MAEITTPSMSPRLSSDDGVGGAVVLEKVLIVGEGIVGEGIAGEGVAVSTGGGVFMPVSENRVTIDRVWRSLRPNVILTTRIYPTALISNLVNWPFYYHYTGLCTDPK